MGIRSQEFEGVFSFLTSQSESKLVDGIWGGEHQNTLSA